VLEAPQFPPNWVSLSAHGCLCVQWLMLGNQELMGSFYSTAFYSFCAAWWAMSVWQYLYRIYSDARWMMHIHFLWTIQFKGKAEVFNSGMHIFSDMLFLNLFPLQIIILLIIVFRPITPIFACSYMMVLYVNLILLVAYIWSMIVLLAIYDLIWSRDMLHGNFGIITTITLWILKQHR
jgi:hypothetical protein